MNTQSTQAYNPVVSAIPSKVVCVGRNYAEHAKELGNEVPQTPILFIKPSTSVVNMDAGIVWDNALGSCHYETELCVRIGQTLSKATTEQVQQAICGVTLGLDLTLRDLQNTLKTQGQPWERAKAFDGACVLGDWVSPAEIKDWGNTQFALRINGDIKQQGNTADMLFGVIDLIAHISQTFTLLAGDVVMTGTPAGVGALQLGDQLHLTLQGASQPFVWQTWVV